MYLSEKKKRQIEIQNLKLGQQTLELNRNKILQYALIGGLLMLVLLSFVVYNRYRIKKKANKQLEAAYNVIEEKSKDITDSIMYARNIQQAILPRESEMKNDLPEHFVYFVPKDIVSGDFYWF
ncbi:MAG: hypothetical protein ABII90_02130 [Bacteroidota bacterium]